MYQRPIPLPTASSMMQRSRADSTTMRAETVRAAAVFLVSFCFYAFTRAQTMAHSRDAIEYMNMIDRNDLYHPHHLLYNWLGSLWVRGFGAVGISADSITLVQLMDAIFGAAFVLVFYAMLRYRVGLGPSSGIVGASLPGLSYGVWAYSTTVEVYVPPLALLWAALFVLSTRRRTARTYLIAGALHGTAVLLHQANALFGVVFITYFWLDWRASPRTLYRNAAAYFAVAAPLVIAPYLIVGFVVLKHASWGEFAVWLTDYAQRYNQKLWMAA